MLVARKYTQDPTVHLPTAELPARLLHGWRMWSEKQPLKAYPERIDTLSPAVASANLRPALRRLAPDIINLHWVTHGFIRPQDLPSWRRPIVWTMHDMWSFTGGCHYSVDCTKYTGSCGACPQLSSSQEHDLSRQLWRNKSSYWESLNLTIVSPSRWLAACARRSSLFHDKRIEVIPYGLDTEVYRPMAKQEIRSHLGLPLESKIILFGAIASTSDSRKGYHQLLPALQRLAQDQSLGKLQLVVVGADHPSDGSTPPIPAHYTGFVRDEHKLAEYYAAADLFVAPSLEDNLPNTVMEALACGTPCVAFRIGGMPDMIEHQANGYLATPYEVEELAKGMAWVLADDERYGSLADRARAKVMQEFTYHQAASKYLSLYTEILHTRAAKDNGQGRNL
jgi:glycosyltransferase involved in cell wall biosynthesis